MTAILDNLLRLIDGPRDNALLRFSIGNEYLKAGDRTSAIEHFREAVTRDPRYSAAWKLLGKTLVEAGDGMAALDAFRRGIEAAEARGDKQAAKEMRVFARRLEKDAKE